MRQVGKKISLCVLLVMMTSCHHTMRQTENQYIQWNAASSELSDYETVLAVWCKPSKDHPSHWQEHKRFGHRKEVKTIVDALLHTQDSDPVSSDLNQNLLLYLKNGQIMVVNFELDRQTQEFICERGRSKILWRIFTEKAISPAWKTLITPVFSFTHPVVGLRFDAPLDLSRIQFKKGHMSDFKQKKVKAFYFYGLSVKRTKELDKLSSYYDTQTETQRSFIHSIRTTLEKAESSENRCYDITRQRYMNFVFDDNTAISLQWCADHQKEIVFGNKWQSKKLYPILYGDHQKTGPFSMNKTFLVEENYQPTPQHRIDQRDEQGMNPLHKAVWHADIDKVKSLLEKGANINIENSEGQTALHIAVWRNNEQIVRLLLSHNAKVNVKNNAGMTPLHLAASQGHDNMVDLLLAHDADFRISSYGNKLTPLHLAASRGYPAIVKKLISAGANINVMAVSQ